MSNEVGFITVTINGETRTYSMHESRPEPAAQVNGHTPIGEYDPDMKPAAQGEMPRNPPFSVVGHDGKKVAQTTDGMAWAKEFCWRMRNGLFSGPIDEGMMVGWFANAIEAGRTAGRTHSQPVAVGMTEELSMVLLRAEYGATEDERNPNLRDGYVARLKSAIETVRQQAAQVKL